MTTDLTHLPRWAASLLIADAAVLALGGGHLATVLLALVF